MGDKTNPHPGGRKKNFFCNFLKYDHIKILKIDDFLYSFTISSPFLIRGKIKETLGTRLLFIENLLEILNGFLVVIPKISLDINLL